MPGLRDIKRRLQTARNIRKITYAMKLVSTAKLKKAQEFVVNTREYTTALRDLIQELRNHAANAPHFNFTHPLLEMHEIRRKIGVVIVGGSRGLCGGYNTNINRKLEGLIMELGKKYPEASFEFIVLGKKPADYFKRTGRSAWKVFDSVGEDVYSWPLEEISLHLEQQYGAGELDEVYVVYTRFKSAVSVTPVSDMLLPIVAKTPVESSQIGSVDMGDIIFEPSPEAIFSSIIPKILRVRLLQAALDAKASEHGSRMSAMDNATNNGDELIQRLQLLHNKLRQGTITSELLDIIGGANALE